jgi:hypothetical protein
LTKSQENIVEACRLQSGGSQGATESLSPSTIPRRIQDLCEVAEVQRSASRKKTLHPPELPSECDQKSTSERGADWKALTGIPTRLEVFNVPRRGSGNVFQYPLVLFSAYRYVYRGSAGLASRRLARPL